MYGLFNCYPYIAILFGKFYFGMLVSYDFVSLVMLTIGKDHLSHTLYSRNEGGWLGH